LTVWNDLPEEFIDKAITVQIQSFVAAVGGHFEHSV